MNRTQWRGVIHVVRFSLVMLFFFVVLSYLGLASPDKQELQQLMRRKRGPETSPVFLLRLTEIDTLNEKAAPVLEIPETSHSMDEKESDEEQQQQAATSNPLLPRARIRFANGFFLLGSTALRDI